MIDLPDPEDVGKNILVWLGLPSIVIGAYTFTLALLAWREFVKNRVRDVRTARDNLRRWTTDRQRATVRLIAAGAAFVAIAYSLTQLAGVTYQRIGGHASIAEGLSFDSGYLFAQLVGYQHWTRLSGWTVLAALASIFLLNVANLIGATGLRKTITALWGLVLFPAVLAGGLLAFDGLCVLILGLTHSDHYQPSMTWLYVLWVACLFGLPWLGGKIQDASATAFRSGSP